MSIKDPLVSMAIKLLLILLLYSPQLINCNEDIEKLYRQCYTSNVACFGVLNGKISIGHEDGCIKDYNCNVALIAHKDEEGYIPKYQYHLVSKWDSSYSSTKARFFISNQKEASKFDTIKFVEAVSERSNKPTYEGYSLVHSRGTDPLEKVTDLEQNHVSAYYLDELFPDTNNFTATFTTKFPGYEIFYNGDSDFPNVDLARHVHIYLEYWKDGKKVDEANTHQVFVMFRVKDQNNSPTTTSTTTSTTTTTTTTRPPPPVRQSSATPPLVPSSTPINPVPEITSSTEPSSTSILQSDMTTTLPSNDSKKKDEKSGFSLMMIIIIVVVLLVVILVIGILVYCCLKKRNKKSSSSRRSLLPTMTDEDNELLERIRGGGAPTSRSGSGPVTKSGNYKKNINKKQDKVSKRKSTAGGTTIFSANNDNYSTYFNNNVNNQ